MLALLAQRGGRSVARASRVLIVKCQGLDQRGVGIQGITGTVESCWQLKKSKIEDVAIDFDGIQQVRAVRTRPGSVESMGEPEPGVPGNTFLRAETSAIGDDVGQALARSSAIVCGFNKGTTRGCRIILHDGLHHGIFSRCRHVNRRNQDSSLRGCKGDIVGMNIRDARGKQIGAFARRGISDQHSNLDAARPE